ncbi:HD domain-containing protein [Sporomusa termitida]|uniref:HD domain protein n=1 Tax=Sporomusa termitida TaxID=2377 RepID=A0A517DXY3_9FIRM|nr:HD domain-containing protein [Sporomusa termitida]QDR82217.1 HD domain protein [Sporomusa termitida]
MSAIDYLYEWFRDHVRTYYTSDEFIMTRVLLKEEHSKRVAAIAASLAAELQLAERPRLLAEVIGLFHDLARFRQVAEYRTFVDAESFDHGDAGAAALARSGLLADFTAAEQAVIGFAIANHNKMQIPPACSQTLLFAKLIRDADKLDIFRLLPPVQADHDYSPQLLGQLKPGGVLSYRDVKTLADKRLIRLSWFYDIYFDWTLAQLIAEGHLERQLDSLPDTGDCRAIKATLQAYVDNRLTGESRGRFF